MIGIVVNQFDQKYEYVLHRQRVTTNNRLNNFNRKNVGFLQPNEKQKLIRQGLLKMNYIHWK